MVSRGKNPTAREIEIETEDEVVAEKEVAPGTVHLHCDRCFCEDLQPQKKAARKRRRMKGWEQAREREWERRSSRWGLQRGRRGPRLALPPFSKQGH
jgi:hypothetical protein